MRLILLVITFFMTSLSLYSHAASYSGKIIRTQNQTLFVDQQDQRNYILHSATPLIATYVNKLSDGDFVSFDGIKNFTDKSVTVNSFSYVGLKKLVGTWYGDDNYCYTFHTFTEFSISRKFGNTCLPPSRPNYTYLLSPTSSSWVIIISASGGGNYLGDLHFYETNEVGFQLYNPESDDILRSIRLRK